MPQVEDTETSESKGSYSLNEGYREDEEEGNINSGKEKDERRDHEGDDNSVNKTTGNGTNQLTEVKGNEGRSHNNKVILSVDNETDKLDGNIECLEGQNSDNNFTGNESGKIENQSGHINYTLDLHEEGQQDTKEHYEENGENGEAKKKKEAELDSGSASYTPVGEKPQGKFSSWWIWLRKELKCNKKLIPIKIIQFLYSGGTNSMLPYLTLQMKELGLSLNQIGWIYAFLPITTILAPPIAGMVADRTGNYKGVVLVNMILTTILHVALMYLPGEGVNKITFTCGGSQELTTFTWDKCRDCHDSYDGMNFSVTLKNCRYLCDSPPSSTFEMCLGATRNTTEFCQQHNLADEIITNGTIAATNTEVGICGHSWYEVKMEEQVYSGISCPSASCPIECDVGGVPACQDDASSNVFAIYFFVRITANFFLSALFTMMDAMTIAIVKDHGGDYGKQRLLFIIGMATVPLVAGFLNDWDAGANGTSFYLPALYLGAVLCLASAVLIARLNFKVDMAQDNIFRDLRKLVTRPEINVYFLVILVLGSNWGFIESYLFLYMGQLGSPNYIMGLTMTVGSVLGMPTMLVADPVIKVIGRHNIFIISFFAYALRHFGYSFISSPWMVFPFEVLEVFTYQLMWVAAITYCPILAPPGLLATMTGVAGAVHFSMGRGVGSFIGGQLMTKMEIPAAFRCYGGIAIVSGVLYILLHLFYFKKKIARRELELKRSEAEAKGVEMTERD